MAPHFLVEFSSMPNDAKLGLVVGVSLVIIVAVFFFRKEAPAIDPAAATIVKPMPDLSPPPVGNGRTVQAKPTTRGQRSGGRGQQIQMGFPDP